MPAKYNRYSLHGKFRVLEAARNRDEWELMAMQHDVNPSTTRKWVQRYSNYAGVVAPAPRGGATRQKMTPECVAFLCDQLATDPDLTLRQLADSLETSLTVSVCPQTVKNHLDASLIMMKQFHKERQYMNTQANNVKRRDYQISLQSYQAIGKTIIYMDETNFNLWSTRTRGRSVRGQRAVKKVFAGGGQNLQVIACIGVGGVVHYETRFGGNKFVHSNEFIRATLRTFCDLSNVVLVIDNAPCHSRAENVFEKEEFVAATLLQLGPYSPMLNPIENVFSAFKSAVKDYMTLKRNNILAVPEGTTMKAHRQFHLTQAAQTLFPRTATPDLCAACYRHTHSFDFKVADIEDMPVGT